MFKRWASVVCGCKAALPIGSCAFLPGLKAWGLAPPVSVNIVLGDIDITAMWPMRQGNPDGVNYDTPYPVAKGVRDYFAQDVVRAIDVCVEPASIARAKKATLNSLACVSVMLAHRRQVEKPALACVALFRYDYADAKLFRLVLAPILVDHRPWLQPGDAWADDRRTSRRAWSSTVLARPEAASPRAQVRRPCGRRGGSRPTGGQSSTPARGASSP
jgi:hypothetical protein